MLHIIQPRQGAGTIGKSRIRGHIMHSLSTNPNFPLTLL
jgi:hypothetical protein